MQPAAQKVGVNTFTFGLTVAQLQESRDGPSPIQTPVTLNVHWMLLEFMEESFIIVANEAEETLI